MKRGARVSRGHVIGLLGNSGNSDGPHLHFHVMDRPCSLCGNNLPYEFTSYTAEGTLTNIDAVVKGEPATIAPDLRGYHASQLPLNNMVVRF